MQKECSIVVPMWNHLDDVTKPFIEQIIKTKDVNLEIILVDNGSSDGTHEYVEQRVSEISRSGLYPNISFLVPRIQYNIGYGGGMNMGWGFATGKYTCFMNNDVDVDDPLWLRKMIDYLDEHPKTAIGPQLVEDEIATLYKGSPVPFLNGWCMLIPSEFLLEHGAFHPAFKDIYFEDVELSARLRNYGYAVERFSVGLRHLQSKTTKDQINMDLSRENSKPIFLKLMEEMGSSKSQFI